MERLAAERQVVQPRDVRDDGPSTDLAQRDLPLRHRRVVHLLEGGVQMECESDERQGSGDASRVVRDRGIREVLRAEVERPAPEGRPVRLDDCACGPARVEVDPLVEGVRAVDVIVEPIRRAVIHAGVVRDSVPVRILELDERVELDRIERVDLDRPVLGDSAALLVDDLGDPEIPRLDRDDIDVVRVRGRPVDDAERGVRAEPDEHVVAPAERRRRTRLLHELVVDWGRSPCRRGHEDGHARRGNQQQADDNRLCVHGKSDLLSIPGSRGTI